MNNICVPMYGGAMSRFGLVGIILIAGVSASSAADLMRPAPAVPTAFDWTGAYVGLHLGYGWGDSDFVDSEYNGAPPYYPVVNWSVDSDGWLGGAQAGYNFQHGAAVFGVEGEIGYLNLRGTKVQPGLDPYGFPYDGYGKVRGGWYGAISARLGYALDRTLIYVKGGAVYSGAKLGFLDTCTEDPCGNTTISISKKVEWGYLLGAGVEHAWTDNLTAKIEYAYMDFGRSTIHGLGYVGGWNAVPFNIRSDLSVHSVRLGINYKF